MKTFLFFCVVFLGLLFSGCASEIRVRQEPNLKDDRTSRVIHHEFLFLPGEKDKKVEIFWMRPEIEGTFPLLIALHGNQDPERPGGAVWTHGFLQRMVDDRFVTVAISQPGFGNSDGPADYCGPYSQEAVNVVLKHFKRQSWVDQKHVGIYGVGRGATLAGIVAAQDPDLSVLVLQAGIYDLPLEFDALKESGDIEEKSVVKAIEREIGKDQTSFLSRSVVATAGQIHAATMILIGGQDSPTSVKAAHELKEAIEAHGNLVKLVEFKRVGHIIPVDKRIEQVDPFLEEHLIPRQ